jgi:hypothetical protein
MQSTAQTIPQHMNKPVALTVFATAAVQSPSRVANCDPMVPTLRCFAAQGCFEAQGSFEQDGSGGDSGAKESLGAN